MSMHAGRRIVSWLLAAGMGGLAQAATLVDEAQIAAALALPELKPWRRAVDEAEPLDSAQLASLVQKLLDTELNTLARTALLAELLPLLRAAPASPEGRSALSALSRYPNDYELRLDEGYSQTRPAFPIAQQAEAALRWQAGRTAGERGLSGVALQSQPDPAFRAGVAAALEAADADTLAAACAGIRAGDWLALCARRLRNAELYQRLIAQAPEAAAPALAEVRRFLPPATATSLLKAAAEQPALRSAAYYQLAKLPEGPGFLLSELGKPGAGESAAAALAERRSPEVLSGLGTRLAAPDELTQRHAVLALKLRGDEEARALLQGVSRDPAKPEVLRQEVQAWLGQ